MEDTEGTDTEARKDTDTESVSQPKQAKSAKRRRVRQVFVVTPARSGSTLLRYLFDSHPDITCPPEFNLSALLQHVLDAWRQVDAAFDPPEESRELTGAGPKTDSLSVGWVRHARKVVDEIMVSCANAADASVYCDKSLTTVDHLATVTQCYPDAAYVFLYRYPLDVIASGLEASRWGFNAYGFVPYVAANPGNLVGALANYWADKASKMVEFERTCTVRHARIYYELLCDDPVETLGSLFEFLGVSSDERIIERMFVSEHSAGPGDYKIDFTHSISADSIGRGTSLPQHALSDPQITRINEILAELDYPALDAAWRGDLGGLLGLKGAKPPKKSGREIAESLATILAKRSGVLANVHRGALPLEVVIRTGSAADVVVLIDESGRAHIPIEGEERVETSLPRIRSAGDVLLRVAAGELTLAQAVVDGHVRVDLEDASNLVPIGRPRRLLVALGALLTSGG